MCPPLWLSKHDLPLKDQMKFQVICDASLCSKYLQSSLSVPNILVTAPLAFSICCFLFICCCLSLCEKKANICLRFVNVEIRCTPLGRSSKGPCIQYTLCVYDLIICHQGSSGSQSVVPGPAASVSPKNLLKLETFKSHPGHRLSGCPPTVFFDKPCRWFGHRLTLESFGALP